jgi:hypothetical protein
MQQLTLTPAVKFKNIMKAFILIYLKNNSETERIVMLYTLVVLVTWNSAQYTLVVLVT